MSDSEIKILFILIGAVYASIYPILWVLSFLISYWSRKRLEPELDLKWQSLKYGRLKNYNELGRGEQAFAYWIFFDIGLSGVFIFFAGTIFMASPTLAFALLIGIPTIMLLPRWLCDFSHGLKLNRSNGNLERIDKLEKELNELKRGK